MIDKKSLSLASLSPLQVEIRELTMGDMRSMLRARERIGEGEIDPLEMILVGDGLLLSDLSALTNLSPTEIDKLNESDIEQIVSAAREVNPRFFGQILGTLSRFAALSSSVSAASSSATSSSLSRPGTPVPGTTRSKSTSAP